MLYYYCIESYANYQNLLQITLVVRFHYIFGRIVTCAGYAFYACSVWTSAVGQTRICKVPVVKILTLVLITGLVFLVAFFGIPRAFRTPSFASLADHKTSAPWSLYAQVICGAVLTLLKAYDLARSKATHQILKPEDNWFRQTANTFYSLVQTAVFTTGFDVMSLCLRNAKGAGFSYSIMSLTAQIHLLGPIMAISAQLQEDFMAEQAASACSMAKTECQTAVPPTTRRLTFQTQEKRTMKGY